MFLLWCSFRHLLKILPVQVHNSFQLLVVFLDLVFSPLADLHLKPWTCVEGPNEAINRVVYPPYCL
jgi:hypothetical protein